MNNNTGGEMTDKDKSSKTLDRQIADAVMKKIITWEIPPGSWIKEREIAEKFKVSHGPVREAFRHLSQAGFVEVVPWRGAHVIELTPEAVHEIYTLLTSLFGAVCRLAAERFDKSNIAELDKAFEVYNQKALAANNVDTHFNHSMELGRYIASLSKSDFSEQLLNKTAILARWAHQIALHESVSQMQPELSSSSIALYRIVIEMIKAKLPNEAERASRELTDFTYRMLVRTMEQRRDLFSKVN